jgi:predicted ribosome quality control (RQC) complex YloA/Tae2 family protein
MIMKKDMSNVDILAVLTEFREQIRNSWIDNIYQIDSMFIYRFRKPDEGSVNMLVQTSPLQRVYITEYVRTPPKIPPPFCMTLRKYVRNKRVVDIQQHDFDRVMMIEVSTGTKIVIELFGRGNMLLLDPEGQIIIAQHYKKMKDRDVLPKKEYLFPPSRGLDIFQISETQLKKIVESSTGNIIRTLTHFLNIKKIYAEDICLRSNIETTTPASSIKEDEIHAIIDAINSIFQPLNQGLLSPEVIYEKSMPIDVTPIHLITYSNLTTKQMPSFNEGLDFYFGEIEKSKIVEAVTGPKNEQLERLERIHEQQERAIEDLKKSEIKMKQIAEEIYVHSADLREIIHTIDAAYKKGVTWEEILNKIEEGKKKGIHAAELIKDIDMANKNIIIELEGKEIAFGLDQSVEEVASNFYEAAKKQTSKIEGAKGALKKTLHKSEKLKEKGKNEIQEEVVLKKKRKRKWYEKYRWFISSDDVLVLGGRDMTSNKILFKRYMNTEDLFMHAEIAGAPYVIIKTKGEEIPETTLLEAAQFSVSYSRAWRSGLGAGDAYYVLASQVSETAPSGEYIPKGGIMVRGDRKYLKNNPLKVAIGVKIEEEFAIPISGPPSAISHQTENYVHLVPGEIASGKLARHIKELLLKRAKEKDRNKIKRLSADEIIRILPPGNSKIHKT